MKIKIIKGDITKVNDVQAIVNAANATLLGGGGVDGAIHRAAGLKFFFACGLLGGCKTGEAKITKGYRLPCDYVIHTVGPIWRGGKRKEKALLANCYYNSLRLAVDNEIRSVAFPSISTGAFRFPVQLAAEVAGHAVLNFAKEYDNKLDLVEWVLFDKNTSIIYEKVLEDIFDISKV